MTHPALSGEEIEQRGQQLYDQQIAPLVREANEGKICVIDVESGDYEIADTGLVAAQRLRERHPGSAFWAVRIGYDAVYALGGTLAPVKQ